MKNIHKIICETLKEVLSEIQISPDEEEKLKLTNISIHLTDVLIENF